MLYSPRSRLGAGMMQIDWDSIPEAGMGEGFHADLLAYSEGKEQRVPFNGGWINYADAAHTQGDPQSITASTLTLLTIDGLGATSTQRFRRGLSPGLWSDNTLKPNSVGESHLVRVTMQAAKDTGSDTTLELDLGIGSSWATIIANERKPLTKGQGVTDNLSFTFPVFCLETFGQAGGRFFINASQDVSIWAKAIFVQRLFTP